MSRTSKSETEMSPKDHIRSPSTDEGRRGKSASGDGQVLKKGPWTSMEDAILVEYVRTHGEGNWNAVQKNSGLHRCGKSCRLRWANHLRPNLKKGAFTPDEEELIIKLHAQMGNKWARMAAFLPGRTDNEIKNYWNTRIKRHQRAGLPLYPANVCFQASDENQQTQTVSCVTQQHNEILQRKGLDIPDIIFENFNNNHGDLSHALLFPDISMNSMIGDGIESRGCGYLNAVNHVKQLQDSETLDAGYDGTIYNGLPSTAQFPIHPSGRIPLMFGSDYPYDPDPNLNNLVPFGGEITGSHAFSNGNFSASMPISGAGKLELPSLQYAEADCSSWIECHPTLPLEAVDTYVEASPTVSLQSECVSPRKSGLLEALLHEAQALSNLNKHSSGKSSSSSAITHNEVLNPFESEWEEYSDTISPVDPSAASFFNEFTPISSSLFHEPASSKATSVSAGSQNVMAVAGHPSVPKMEVEHISSQLDFSRPDALLGSGWLGEGSQAAEDYSIWNDAIATVLDQDFCKELNAVPAGASSDLVQGIGLESCQWNKMPHVCQMPELP